MGASTLRMPRTLHDHWVRLFSRVSDFLDAVGGIASRTEIVAAGFTLDGIRFAVQFGTVQRLCRGWYGTRDLPHTVRNAWRSGGPLACVSALEFAGLIDTKPGGPPHVCRRTRGHRLRHADSAIIHWSDEALRSGSRFAVAPAAAAAQAALCPAARSRTEDFAALSQYFSSLQSTDGREITRGV